MPKTRPILVKIRKSFAVHFENLAIDGRNLQVLEIENMPNHLDSLINGKKIKNPIKDLPLWAKVWPASLILGRFLRQIRPEGKTMLELGAGMGITSLIASSYGFRKIIASDISDEALDFMTANILRNNLENCISAMKLNFAEFPANPRFSENFDIITGSEILYMEDLLQPLCRLLDHHLEKGGRAVLCTDLKRASPKFRTIAEEKFSVQEGHVGVKEKSETGEEKRSIYKIYILEKK